MSVNGVEIKVGQKWRTRNGKLAEVIAGPDSGVTYMWCVEMLPSGPKWTANENGEQLHDTRGPWDLQFLVEDPDLTLTQPAALMVEEIKLTPHPLRRAADWPEVAAAVDDTAGLSHEPQFEHSLPGALLGPDEALKDIGVTESDPRAQQTADSPKRRAVDDPVVAAIERLQANQDAQGRTPFMQAVERGDIVERPTRTGMSESVSISVSVDTSALHEELAQIQAAASALDRQIGGGHYKQFAIQPVEFIHKNGIGFIEGNCIKYLARWREKGGIQDLEKVKHYIDLLIELERERGES